MTRLLWLSRHKPTSLQVADLQDIFGEDMEIIRKAITVHSPHDVRRLMRENNCTEVMVVLPVHVLVDLLSIGIKPVISIMDTRKGQHSRFVKVHRLCLESERLGGQDVG